MLRSVYWLNTAGLFESLVCAVLQLLVQLAEWNGCESLWLDHLQEAAASSIL